jgi:hypothetical protein
MTECIKGHVYKLRSRNLAYGIYDGNNGFIGIREKFGDLYLFTEYHWDQGPPYGTVRPEEDLGPYPSDDLRERLPSPCKLHDRPTIYDKTQPKPNPHAPDFPYPGTWCHADDGSEMEDGDISMSYQNQEMFDWLETFEKNQAPVAESG